MSNVRLFFNIVSNVVDKEKPYYIPDDGIIMLNGKDWYKYNYFLEAESYDEKNLKHLYIILSKNKIDKCCKSLIHDNFGRTKIRLKEFRNYFNSIYNKNSNIKFSFVDSNNDYDVYSI